MRAAWTARAGALVLLSVACSEGAEPNSQDAGGAHTIAPEELRSGGEATVVDDTRSAYARALPALEGGREALFFSGNVVFNRGWVTAPASVSDFDGLGPLFNADNCSACHLKDGRGRPPERPGEGFTSMLLRLSVPGRDAQGGPMPVPHYGSQLQDQAVLGVAAEGEPRVTYSERAGSFVDGTPYSLRVPSYTIEAAAYGPLPPELQISPRVSPAVFGLGLLAAIDDATLEGLADPDDRDGDGVSGRVNRVWDVQKGRLALGRFGWKANQPSLEQQVLGAFLGDMGISSRSFPLQECAESQHECAAQPSGAGETGTELGETQRAAIVHYMHTLAVPARRGLERPEVVRGQQLFHELGCTGCHLPKLTTGELADFPELSRQTIRPYSDLLLHDMGPELADQRPDFDASGSEWRTPPLWGLGLLETVNQHNYLLHDGRARGLVEAVLWHGGEAEPSRERFRAASASDRAALTAFLESL